MTLLELIIVMAILAALFGIGVGTFRSATRPERIAADQVRDAMRAARLFARAEGVPATVVVRPSAGEIHALGTRTVGNWHFEDEDGTGWPVPARYEAASLTRDGVIGWGLELSGEQQLVVPGPPLSFDSWHGFGVDVYLQPSLENRPMTILERSGSWRLLLDARDELVVVLWLVATAGEAAARNAADGGAVEYRQIVPAARLAPDRPTRLTVVFDGRALRVATDGARAEADTLFPEPRRLVVQSGTAITTGAPPNHYRGLLDELRVASVVMGERQRIPDETTLLGDDQLIHVDAHGHLDPAFHRTPVTVGVGWGDGRSHVVEFGLLGTVRSWDELPTRPGRGTAPASQGTQPEDEP